jgi:hypothetical protein
MISCCLVSSFKSVSATDYLQDLSSVVPLQTLKCHGRYLKDTSKTLVSTCAFVSRGSRGGTEGILIVPALMAR